MTDKLSLTDLLRSTRELHERFGVPFTIGIAERLCAEEFRELIHESAIGDYQLEFGYSCRESIVEEAVDLFVVVLGLLQAHGVSDDMLADAIAAVIAKNDAKTDATHVLINGKITRKAVEG